MTALDRQFNDFILDEIIRILGITKSDYEELIFQAGIKASENNKKYKSYFVYTAAFWDCFGYRANYFNLILIAEDNFVNSVPNLPPIKISVSRYIKLITDDFELPKRTINLINKQYRIDFENSQVVKNGYLKPLKKQRQPRVPKQQRIKHKSI